MKFFAITTFLLVLGSYSNGEKINPLKAEIYKDNFHSLNVGPGERITFELDRPYQPLSAAGMVEDKVELQSKVHFNPDYKPRILATKNTVTFNAEPSFETIQVDDNLQKPQNIEKEMTEEVVVSSDPKQQPSPSRWLSWSLWSSCVGGERTRIRACKRQGIEPCFGTNIETEKCVTMKEVPKIVMASDPWSIEKEISHRNAKL